MRKCFAFVALLLVLPFLFTGCSTPAPTPAAQTDQPAATAQPSAAAATATAAAGKEPVKITWMDYAAYDLDGMDAVMHELKASDNIDVEMIHVSNDYETALKTRINSGDIPDVFMNSAGTGNNETYEEYSYDLTNEPIVSKFIPWTLDACRFDGKLVGLPINIESFGIIYNKDLFAQAGIAQIPKTYTELAADCKTLQDHNNTPFANGYKETWVLFQHQVTAYIAAEGGTADEIAGKVNKGTLSFGTMKYIDNYLRYLDLTMQYGMPKSLETGWEEEENDLATGKAAMIHMGAWCEPTLVKANPNVKVGFIPMPMSDDASQSRMCSDVSWVAKVSASSKNKDAAIRAIEYFLTSDSGLKYTANSGMVLAIQNVTVPRSGQLTSDAAAILAASPVWNWPFNAWPNGFADAGGAIIQKYLAKEIDAAAVKAQLDSTWKNLVANK